MFSGGGANSDMMCSETVETVSDKQDTDQNKYGESESGFRQGGDGVVISGCQKKIDWSYVFVFLRWGQTLQKKKLGVPGAIPLLGFEQLRLPGVHLGKSG